MTLNPEQQEAYDSFHKFADDDEGTLFALFGAAGTGKSFTSGQFLPRIMERFGETLWLAGKPRGSQAGSCSATGWTISRWATTRAITSMAS